MKKPLKFAALEEQRTNSKSFDESALISTALPKPQPALLSPCHWYDHCKSQPIISTLLGVSQQKLKSFSQNNPWSQ